MAMLARAFLHGRLAPILRAGVLAALCTGCAAKKAGQAELIRPVADESSIERKLVQELQDRHAIASELLVHDRDAIILTSFRTEHESWRITIDSEPSSQDGTQRVILVVLDGDFGVSPQEVERARALVNAHNLRFWAGVFFVDEENDILGKWALNMPGVGLHPEQVADAVQRISQSWLELVHAAQDQGIVRIRHAQRSPAPERSLGPVPEGMAEAIY